MKNSLSSATTRSGLSRGELVEPTTSTNSADTSRSRRPGDAALERLARDVGADLAAVEVAQLLALAQPGDHAVEARLQAPDLGAVVDRHRDVQVALADRVDRAAQLAHGSGDGLRGELRGDEARPHGRAGSEPDRRDQLLRVGHLAADRDQRDHQDRHARAQHPREQQPRADAQRARLGRRRAVQRERERGPELPLAGEVDGGAGREPGEQRGDRLLERELARGGEVRQREQRHREQPAHERHAREQHRQAHHRRALLGRRRATFGEPAAHAPELRLGAAVERDAADQRVEGDGQRDLARPIVASAGGGKTIVMRPPASPPTAS